MEHISTSFYKDWSFWAVFVSAIAVALSQMPPIHIILKKANLDLELYSKLSISHGLGNPNLQSHLILSNTGGRRVRVKDIKISISRDGEHLMDLPAQNYLQKQHDQNTVLFTPFSLEPMQEWAHTTNFLNFFNRDDEKIYREIEKNMRADFKKYQESRSDVEKNSHFYEHPNSLVQPAVKFFERHFCWFVGEYTMTVNVVTDQRSANVTKSYRFTVFESHTETLESLKDSLKYGSNIYWNDTSVLTSVILELKEG